MYGITEAHYQWMLEQQGGCCAICKGKDPRHRFGRFLVDHCHESGDIRGLLCHNCNLALGMVSDSRDILNSAIQYLATKNDGLVDGLREQKFPEPEITFDYNPESYRKRLTWDDVREIRKRIKNGESQKSISADFPVSQEMISRIHTGKAWIEGRKTVKRKRHGGKRF